MEELNKSQVVLLVLLVSFVTSIATGIVTVTLLDQAPPEVSQQINRIVEKTIETVVPAGPGKTTIVQKEVIVNGEELIISAVEKNISNVVQIKFVHETDGEKFLGNGILMNKKGVVATDRRNVAGIPKSMFTIYSGQAYPLSVLHFDEKDTIALLQIEPNVTKDDKGNDVRKEGTFSGIITGNSSSLKRGQTAISIGGQTGKSVGTGIITDLEYIDQTTGEGEDKVTEQILSSIKTNLTLSASDSGGPLFNLKGEMIGMNIVRETTNTIPTQTILDTIASTAKTSEGTSNPNSGIGKITEVITNITNVGN